MGARYLIVGHGPAGSSAAFRIRLHDPEGSILVVGEERHAFYSRPGLAYLLTGAIPEKSLFSRPDAEYGPRRIRRETARVDRLDPGGHRVRLSDGRWLGYDRLLLGLGAQAVLPDVPGIELEGVVSLDNLADARRILRLSRRARRAVVVGGGITALELAEGLAAQGLETHYLLRRDRYWGNVLEADESALVETRLEKEGIRLHRRSEVQAVLGRKGRVVGVALEDGRTLACDLLGVAIGIRPRLELARQAGLETGRGVWTDEFFRTSDPDVFAAGDVAEVLDPGCGERRVDSLWSVAVEQGELAGANMAGARRAYLRSASFNVTRIGGVTTTLVGAVGTGGAESDLVALARGDSDDWRDGRELVFDGYRRRDQPGARVDRRRPDRGRRGDGGPAALAAPARPGSVEGRRRAPTADPGERPGQSALESNGDLGEGGRSCAEIRN